MFKFSLESVLKLQYQFEEQAKNALGQITAKLNREIDILKSLEQELNFLHEQIREKDILTPYELQNYHNFAGLLNERRVRQKLLVDKIQQEVSLAKGELVARKQEVQKLERLKEKRLVEFQLHELRQEQTVLDEIATGQFIRNNVPARSDFF